MGKKKLKRDRLISADEAVVTPSQHKLPCSDCPWARKSLPGWLGGVDADEWLMLAHGEALIECHTKKKSGRQHHQCAGAAIYRANVGKLCRDPSLLRCDKNTDLVFGTPGEFKDHHQR